MKDYNKTTLVNSSSLFDPLGMITPFAIRIRSLLQAVSKQGKKWDEEVPAKFHIDLQKWIEEFMPDFTTKRCQDQRPVKSFMSLQVHQIKQLQLLFI